MFGITRRIFSTGLQSQARRFSASPLSLNTSSTIPTDATEGERNIYQKLTEKFAPSHLQVQDVSGGCGTFYAITISSQVFEGLPIVKQHKLVTQTLKQEIEGIHGLQV
ncbi:bola-like protein [Dendrothele bispora CBS 962.96]|uniref:Bola-like protein n=1 Tax=Dendrothele bispora (strain CBS 962.96) TaxID=1314807 RepID=A0A4S8MR89_DENBC|nr:bola-like protein [Dendrothele bispora CBS 962.96]